jgi:hypothetical protein
MLRARVFPVGWGHVVGYGVGEGVVRAVCLPMRGRSCANARRICGGVSYSGEGHPSPLGGELGFTV